MVETLTPLTLLLLLIIPAFTPPPPPPPPTPTSTEATLLRLDEEDFVTAINGFDSVRAELFSTDSSRRRS